MYSWARNPQSATNKVDKDGNPSGGHVKGNGLEIRWQNGPLGRPPMKPNGAFVEDVLEAARQRLDFYQRESGGKFACRENALAITHIEEAILWLQQRRLEREQRGVQGTHQP